MSQDSGPAQFQCFLCEEDFPYSRGRFDGHGFPAWDIRVCGSCYRLNWDGIARHMHPRLMAHLKGRGVTLELNAQGYLKWPE